MRSRRSQAAAAAPIRMFVHVCRNIGLIDHAQQILERYRKQAGFGPRQKARDGIKIVTVDGVIRSTSVNIASAAIALRRFRRDRSPATVSAHIAEAAQPA